MADLTLYGYYRSSCSYRVRIALELKGLAYDYQAVHLVKDGGEHKQTAYLALNPMGQVPCLIHRQRAIAQSVAIIEYLEALFPEYKLFPEDPYDQARVRQLCENINSGIQPIQNLGVLKRLQTQFSADESAKAAWVRHWIQLGFEALEQELAATAGDYGFGNRPGVVDCFLVPQVYNALRFELPMAHFPIIRRINGNCLSLPAFQKADPSVQPDAPQ